jgi:ribosomal protein S11
MRSLVAWSEYTATVNSANGSKVQNGSLDTRSEYAAAQCGASHTLKKIEKKMRSIVVCARRPGYNAQ